MQAYEQIIYKLNKNIILSIYKSLPLGFIVYANRIVILDLSKMAASTSKEGSTHKVRNIRLNLYRIHIFTRYCI